MKLSLNGLDTKNLRASVVKKNLIEVDEIVDFLLAATVRLSDWYDAKLQNVSIEQSDLFGSSYALCNEIEVYPNDILDELKKDSSYAVYIAKALLYHHIDNLIQDNEYQKGFDELFDIYFNNNNAMMRTKLIAKLKTVKMTKADTLKELNAWFYENTECLVFDLLLRAFIGTSVQKYL